MGWPGSGGRRPSAPKLRIRSEPTPTRSTETERNGKLRTTRGHDGGLRDSRGREALAFAFPFAPSPPPPPPRLRLRLLPAPPPPPRRHVPEPIRRLRPRRWREDPAPPDDPRRLHALRAAPSRRRGAPPRGRCCSSVRFLGEGRQRRQERWVGVPARGPGLPPHRGRRRAALQLGVSQAPRSAAGPVVASR
jgi:hypothetical protein